MSINRFSRPMTLISLALLIMLACNIGSAPTAPTSPPTVAQSTETEPAFTETSEPTSTTEGNQEISITVTSTTGPSCTVLQDLNLRFGPGTAYRPPIRALPGNSSVIPLGFVPQGIPGGSWAYVQDPATGDKGWVSAGAQFISCNVELATLPAVDFGSPPPPALPKSTQTSNPDGSGFCVDPDSEFVCVGIFSDESLFQFQILKNGVAQGQNDGVGPVSFSVTRNDNQVYSTVENNAPYCILGGNGPCNGWVDEGGVYKWTPGGAPIEPGKYKLNVDATVNGQDTHWEVEFSLTLP